jgi:secondary thiamine-phosphate synthase enzyme
MDMEIHVSTSRRSELIDITEKVKQAIAGKEAKAIIVSSPHTTCGITINEGYDPDVQTDMIKKLDKMVPKDEDYKHDEGNSDSHIKTSLIGTSVTIPMENNKLNLGQWQSIYLAEFDGPRERKINITLV